MSPLKNNSLTSGPTEVITVRDTQPYGHAPTYQISLTYLERKKLMVRTSFAEKQKKKKSD